MSGPPFPSTSFSNRPSNVGSDEAALYPMHLSELTELHCVGQLDGASQAELRIEFAETNQTGKLSQDEVIIFDGPPQGVRVFFGNRLIGEGTLVSQDGRVGVVLAKLEILPPIAEAA